MVEEEKEFEKLLEAAKASGAAVEIEGITFVNCTPHPLKFEDGSVIQGNKELAGILKATAKEVIIKEIEGIQVVTTRFVPEEKGQKLCEYAIDSNILLIGSIIAAQCYGRPVVSPIAVNPRAPPSERKIYKHKWNCYW